jgi:hypothetical protein
VDEGTHFTPRKATQHTQFKELMDQGWEVMHWNKREDKDRYYCKISDGKGAVLRTERIFTNLKKETLGEFVDIHGKEGGFAVL